MRFSANYLTEITSYILQPLISVSSDFVPLILSGDLPKFRSCGARCFSVSVILSECKQEQLTLAFYVL